MGEGMKLYGGLMTCAVNKLIERWIKKKFGTNVNVNLKGLYVGVDGDTTRFHLDIKADVPTDKLNEVIKNMI